MKRRTLALVAVLVAPSLVLLAAATIVFRAYRIAPPQPLDAAERAQILAPLRAVLDDETVPPPPCPLHRAGGPIAVTVWLDGRSFVRVDGAGPDLGAATDAAAAALRGELALRALSPAIRARARLQVDVIAGRGALGANHWLGALALPGIADGLAVDPGIDGIAAELAGTTTYVLPHELVAAKLLATHAPSDAIPDFAIGADLKRIANIVATRAGLHMPAPASALFRFRTDAFVEPPRGTTGSLPLTRGAPPPPPLTAATLRAAALAGGRYLVAHLSPSGRYIYEHDLATGTRTDPEHSRDYSMPRHAGTTYFLAQLYRITGEPWLREPIERAFAHLAELLGAGHCAATLPDGTPIDCVLDRTEREADLCSTALTVVALAEYQRATGDPRYLPLATKFTRWLLWMQRPDGSFRHRYDPATRTADEHAMELYCSGEAALALARMHRVTGDARYVAAAERALDWLVHWYEFFLGGFFFGEEHWTCIAAEAIWPAVTKPAYREFCDDYGAFLRTQQPVRDELDDQSDFAGAYMVTPFVPPANTPSGSRTEAMISAYLLGAEEGAPDGRLRGEIRATLAYLLGQQLRPENDFAAAGGEVDGAVPATPIERTVRIDYVQHVCSAMIRASEWLDPLQ